LENKFERAIEMRRSVQTTQVVMIGIVFVIMFLTGCQEESLSDTKKSRLIADENRQLKQQLSRRDREIAKQKELLELCLEEKRNLESLSAKQIENIMGGAFENISRENAEIVEENEKLRAEIDELKKQLEER